MVLDIQGYSLIDPGSILELVFFSSKMIILGCLKAQGAASAYRFCVPPETGLKTLCSTGKIKMDLTLFKEICEDLDWETKAQSGPRVLCRRTPLISPEGPLGADAGGECFAPCERKQMTTDLKPDGEHFSREKFLRIDEIR